MPTYTPSSSDSQATSTFIQPIATASELAPLQHSPTQHITKILPSGNFSPSEPLDPMSTTQMPSKLDVTADVPSTSAEPPHCRDAADVDDVDPTHSTSVSRQLTGSLAPHLVRESSGNSISMESSSCTAPVNSISPAPMSPSNSTASISAYSASSHSTTNFSQSAPAVREQSSCSPISNLHPTGHCHSTSATPLIPTRRHISTSSVSSANQSVNSSVDSSPQSAHRQLLPRKHTMDSVTELVQSTKLVTTSDSSAHNSQSDESDDMQLATPHPSAPTTLTTVAVASTSKLLSKEESAGSVVSSVKDQDDDDASMTDATSATASAGGDNATSSSSSSSSSSTSTKKTVPRYDPVRTLQNSLFGQVQLAYDRLRKAHVAVKISHAALVQPKSNLPSSKRGNDMSDDSKTDFTATSRSQAGVSVLEDVHREARILKLLVGDDLPSLRLTSIHDKTCGLSQALLDAIHLPKNAVSSDPSNPKVLSIQQQFLNSLNKGRRFIAAFYEEVEAEAYHYLISEFVPGGDLFSVLTTQPQHKVHESVCRQFFYQLCCSVRYLHANSVAHLDLSLENCCLDEKGTVKTIDFGLAAQHPLYKGDKVTTLTDGTTQRNCSIHLKLLSADAAVTATNTPTTCDCHACTVTNEELMATDPAVLAAKNANAMHKLKFLCRPVCERLHKPGKLGYLAHELYSNHAFDAYKGDVFALGVILYSMLTGRPPFSRPSNEDVWFRVIYSGQWLMPAVRNQPPAAIYTNLSPNALELINLMIKPQHLRPSIDQVLQSPFFTAGHPGNAPVTPNSNRILRKPFPPMGSPGSGSKGATRRSESS